LKGLVNGLDLAGTCLGIQERDKVVSGDEILPGDAVIGVPSSGIHSNGLSLARSIVESLDAWEERLSSGRTIASELLAPTRIYREALVVAAETEVHGMCHITGGGLLNFRRLSQYGFDITDPLPPTRSSPGSGRWGASAWSRCTGLSTWAWAMHTSCRNLQWIRSSPG